MTKQQRDEIRKFQIDRYKNKFVRKGGPGSHQTPDYMRPFKAPVPQNHLKKIAKDIINGSFDDKAEDDYINIMNYLALSKGEKPHFRARNLKHIPLKELKKFETPTLKHQSSIEDLEKQFRISRSPLVDRIIQQQTA